ncbi:Pao retrotransposon peptidase family protein [Aphelenchoides avenae]|nr:Pao retrotransposon peptidase family protein [Aphelenchus avenae]
MNIREFISNSEALNQAIPELDRARTSGAFGCPNPTPWPPNNAQTPPQNNLPRRLNSPTARLEHRNLPEKLAHRHVAACRKVQNARHLTMQVMTSIIHSLWDPFNLLSPVTLQARILLQRVTNGGFGWDDKLPANILDDWKEATSTWPNMSFELKRHVLGSPGPHTIQMHCFVDASGVAYAAVTYLRICDSKGNVHVQPIFAKSRVKAKKPVLTIPRLELMAVLIGCRMTEYLRKELSPTVVTPTGHGTIPTYVWCDNQGALYWVRDSAHRYGRFVQNRLDEIRRVEEVNFRYINTHENPADVAFRGATAPELQVHKLWWDGPNFLRSPENKSPPQQDYFQPFQEDQLGIDAQASLHTEAADMAFTVQRTQKRPQPTPTLLELIVAGNSAQEMTPRRQTLGNICRVTVHIIRIAQRMPQRRGRTLAHPLLQSFRPEHPPNSVFYGTELIGLPRGRQRVLHLPTTKEEGVALRLVIWSAQQAHKPSRDLVEQFQLARSPDAHRNAQNRGEPLWLPDKCLVAKHIAFHLHLFHQHAPINTTLGFLRRNYWVAHGRRFLCTVVRNWRAGCRMPCRPFAFIGLDLFGPYVVSTGQKPANSPVQAKPRRRAKITRDLPSHMQKVWGVIFTCMATRAVQLEVVHSQSAAHLLLAFDAFVSRRGYPDSVTSDNGSNIVLVSKTLDRIWKELLQNDATKDRCRQHGIAWHFITPEAPWQGGFYEKLVHTVKRSLNTAIGRRHLRPSGAANRVYPLELDPRKPQEAADERAPPAAHPTGDSTHNHKPTRPLRKSSRRQH